METVGEAQEAVESTEDHVAGEAHSKEDDTSGDRDQIDREKPFPPAKTDEDVSVLNNNQTQTGGENEDVAMQEADSLSDVSELSDLPES
jgi:hypothetical protein